MRFPNLDVDNQLRIDSFDIRGGASASTLVYLKEIVHRESPKSVIASLVYSRISVAIQRAIAYNTMEYRLRHVPAVRAAGGGP